MKFLSLSPKAILAVIFNKILDWFKQDNAPKNHKVVYVEIQRVNKLSRPN
jgi:hypothetical protein